MVASYKVTYSVTGVVKMDKYDELVYLSDQDPELKDALNWADKRALEKGVSLNVMIKMILDLRIKRKSTSNC